jgi:hypothetical protein
VHPLFQEKVWEAVQQRTKDKWLVEKWKGVCFVKNTMLYRLKQLNFSELIQVAEGEGVEYSFNKYRNNNFTHDIKGFCTSCEKKGCNVSTQSSEYKLSTISHGSHTIDFLEAMAEDKPDTSSWHEQSVMFVFETPSNENDTYKSLTYKDITKKPTKEWYWIHGNKKYAEFPQYFEKGKHYGNLVLSMVNTFRLKNAYVTNLVKCGLNNEKGQFQGIESFSYKCVCNCFENFLQKEIDIVQPDVVFAFSKNVKKWIKKLAPNLPVYYLPHPAGRTKNKLRRMAYFWEVAQGLHDAGIITDEEVRTLAVKYIHGSKKHKDLQKQ